MPHAVRLSLQRLEDRTTPAGSLTVAGDFNATAYAPDGQFRELVWNGGTLKLRTFADATNFAEETVLTEGDPLGGLFIETPGYYPRRPDQAQLVVTPDGASHVFKVASDSRLGAFVQADGSIMILPGLARELTVEHYAKSDAGWSLVEEVAIPADVSGGLYQLVAEAGPAGQFHLGVTWSNEGLTGGKIFHAEKVGESWRVAEVAVVGPLNQEFQNGGLESETRSFDLAVDAANRAHIAYSPGYYADQITPGQIGARVVSELAYATNDSGTFQSAVVGRVPDGTGDAALSLSIATGPNGQVGIAAHQVDRYATGSPQSSALVYHARTGPLAFSAEVVQSTPDGYVGTDGANFTGANPDLEFDPAGRPVIAYSDHASRHIPGAHETSGQIRLAVRYANGWNSTTVFRQTNAVNQQVAFPTLSTSKGQYTITALINNFGNFDVQRFGLTPPGAVPPVVPPPAALPVFDPIDGIGVGAVAADAGGQAVVLGFDAAGNRNPSFSAFEAGYAGGSRLALGDVNGDGVRDVIIAAGPGRVATVDILDGKTGTAIDRFTPFEPTFDGGLFVASADIDGDGMAEIVVTPDRSGGPRVRVLSGADRSVLADFFGIDDSNFRGGARAAVGDVDGDGVPDLLVGAGIGGGPRVAAFNGLTLRANRAPAKLFNDVFVFEDSLRNGVFLAAGDIDGDGFGELIAGGGPGGAPRVLALDGRELVGGSIAPRANFFAGDVNNRDGVRVSVQDLDGDDRADLVVGSGSGSRVTGYAAGSLIDNAAPAELWNFDAFPGFDGGVFVG